MELKYPRIISFFFILLVESPANAQWTNMNGGTNGLVHATLTDSNSLIVTGSFSIAGGINADCIAVWDGADWHPYADNPVFSANAQIFCILRWDNKIIIGGNFTSVNSIAVNNIVSWDGQIWEPLGSGLDGTVYSLQVFNNELYAGGIFSVQNQSFQQGLARYSGGSWTGFTGFIGNVYSLAIHDNKLIVGGEFTNQIITNLVGFDGTGWDTGYSQCNDRVIKVRNINDTLYACGDFTASSFNPSNYLGYYVNSTWHSMPIPTGGQNTITDIIEFNGEKYVCGYFSNPNDLGKLNSSGSYDSVFSVNGFIKSMNIYNNKLIVAGNFILNTTYTTFKCIAEFSGPVSVNEYLSNNFLISFANPQFSANVKLRSLIYDSVDLTIYNSQGRIVENATFSEYFSTSLQPGMYILRAIFRNQIVTTKLTVI